MQLWEQMCATVTDTSPRRGAMMGVMACDHPGHPRVRRREARRRQAHALQRLGARLRRVHARRRRRRAVEARVPALRAERTIRARELWDLIVGGAYASAEPGVLFIDRIRAEDNLAYCETISATNPCGEIPLPPYGACDLGSINLAAFVRDPFTPKARLDADAIGALVPVAVRMLDNVWTVTRFPVPAQAEQGRSSRRLGLGITGPGRRARDARAALRRRGRPRGGGGRDARRSPSMRTPRRSSSRASTARVPALRARAVPRRAVRRAAPCGAAQGIARTACATAT